MSAQGAAIVKHYAIVNLLRRVDLLRRSIFCSAGPFGKDSPWQRGVVVSSSSSDQTWTS